MVEGGTRRWRWQQTTAGELVAEFLGTFVIMPSATASSRWWSPALNQSGRGNSPSTAATGC